MEVKQLLRKVAKGFELKLNTKDKYKFLYLSKREIIIRNFLTECPDPDYVKYRSKNKGKIGYDLINYLKSKEYKGEIRKQQGCLISKEEIKKEIKKIPLIPDEKLRKEVKWIYERIKRKIGNSKKLTLINKRSFVKRKEKYDTEVLLHEFVHELLENNGIRPKSWKWNEGLVTYITRFGFDKHKKFEKKPHPEKDKMWNIYAEHAHEWAKLLKGANTPEERKMIIVRQAKRK